MSDNLNTDLGAIEQELVASGKVVLKSAVSALVYAAGQVSASVEEQVTADVPKVEDAALQVALDVIPSGPSRDAVRAILTPVSAAVEAKVNPVVDAAIHGVIVAGIARLAAAVGA